MERRLQLPGAAPVVNARSPYRHRLGGKAGDGDKAAVKRHGVAKRTVIKRPETKVHAAEITGPPAEPTSPGRAGPRFLPGERGEEGATGSRRCGGGRRQAGGNPGCPPLFCRLLPSRRHPWMPLFSGSCRAEDCSGDCLGRGFLVCLNRRRRVGTSQSRLTAIRPTCIQPKPTQPPPTTYIGM